MYRIIYKSRSTRKIDWDLVRDILHTSDLNNEKRDLTGVLLATETHFLQVLEGSFEDVNEIFMRIARDPRHDDVTLIGFDVIEARLFKGWTMRGIGVFDLNQDIRKQLVAKYGEEDGSVKFPLKVWLVLALINDIEMVGSA